MKKTIELTSEEIRALHAGESVVVLGRIAGEYGLLKLNFRTQDDPETPNQIEVSKESFDKYEAVRESGVTNMLDIKTVMILSALSRSEIIEIQKNYGDYRTKFNEV